jgi:predicted permease
MPWLSKVVSVVRDAVRGSRLDAEIDQELQFHLDAEIENGLEAGLTPEEARRAAHARLGAPLSDLREEVRTQRGVALVDDFARDLAHGARLLRRQPAFASVVVVTLAVALGAAVTAFSLADAWLFRPLAFANADRLVVAFGATPNRPSEPAVWLPYRAYLAWRGGTRSFSHVSAAFFRGATVTTPTEARSLVGMRVTPEFFDTLGVSPLLGRPLDSDDPTGPRTVVLSHGFWQRVLGARPDVIGSSVTLSEEPYTVVGVMPREFDVRLLDRSEGAEFWIALRPGERGYEANGMGPVTILARLREGVAVASAHAEAAAITRAAETPYAINFNAFVVNLTPLQADNTRTVRTTLLAVAGAASLLLLVAAINVCALILGRGLDRRSEAAVRVALGARRGRLIRQFLTESLLLSCLGGAGGLVVASMATRLFVAWKPLGSLPPNAVTLNLRAFAIAGLAVTATTLLCGVLPAMRSSGVRPLEALRSGASRTFTGTGRRAQSVLLSSQLALSVVVLVASALLARTFLGLQAEPLGFESQGLTVATVTLPTSAFPTQEERHGLYRRLEEVLLERPGIRVVAASTSAPLNAGPPVTVHQTAIDDPADPRFSSQDVSTGFFEAMEIAVVAGRVFDARDGASSMPALVLNTRAAAQLFGKPSAAVGQRVRLDDESWREVIGVVGDVRSSFFNTLEWRTDPIVYRPAVQHFGMAAPAADGFSFELHLRGDDVTAADLRQALGAVSSRAHVTEVRRASELVAVATRQPAFRMMLLLAFAAASLGLAAIGIYALVLQTVTQRLPEVAVRLALGARAAGVAASLARSALVVGLVGLAAGAIGAAMLGRLWESMLYGVRSTDAPVLAVAGGLLLGVTTLAALVPAFRATRIDPVRFLRG